MTSMRAQNPVERLFAARQLAEEELLLGPMPQALKAESGTEGFGYENIVGVGIAERVVGDNLTGEEVVAVYVIHKASLDQVDCAALVPSRYEGVPTDVVESGEFVAQTERGRHRPALAGVSLAHHAETAGTLGFVARRDDEIYVVSNNHVLARENQAAKGDKILQPAPFDGGRQADELTQLAGWESLDFAGGKNSIDAAYALTQSDLASSEIYGVGALDPEPQSARRGLLVCKRGRTTRLTRGIVSGVGATVKMPYRRGLAVLDDQVIVRGLERPFSDGGDSGSLVFEESSRRPVGLLCGGSSRLSVVNRIERVLDGLGVSLVA
jgi:hypothetical protein